MVSVSGAKAQSPIFMGNQKNFQNVALKTSFKYDVKAKKEYRPFTISQEMVDGKKIIYTRIYFDTILAMLSRKNTR